MVENDILTSKTPTYNVFGSLLILSGFILVGLLLGQLFGLLVASALTGIPFDKFTEVLAHPAEYPYAWLGIMAMQGLSAMAGFVVAPSLYLTWIERRSWHDFQSSTPLQPYIYLLVFLLVVVFMPFNGWIVKLNEQMQLPGFLKYIEVWMRQKEDMLAELTTFLTNFSEGWQLLLGLLVVAVIPAIGEEFLFRGIVQNLFLRASRNHHAAIWFSAVLFSAIHLQFYGFVPRMLLGAMFGYLYWWTKDLRVSIFAHFVNNGFMLLMIYLFRSHLTEVDIEKTNSVSIQVAAVSLLLTASFLYLIRRLRQKGGFSA